MHARQLVHENEWTTMATISVQYKGAPYNNVVSYSGAYVRTCMNGVGYM